MALNFGTTGSGADASGYGVSSSNYLDVFGFDNAPENTNLPQIYEREVTIYGNRTLMGFLRMIGSETATNSQQIRWAEQKRLHIFVNDATKDSDTSITGLAAGHAFRKADKILVGDGTNTALFIVTTSNATSLDVAIYSDSASGIADDATVSVLVVGSEVGKGSDSREGIVQPKYDSYTNSTVIMRDTYGVNGTDANQIGWVESVDENGSSGKYWYLKGKSETMTRWEDYLELSLLEDRKLDSNSIGKGAADTTVAQTGSVKEQLGAGSEGLFEAIEERGSIATNGFGDAGAADFRESLDNYR